MKWTKWRAVTVFALAAVAVLAAWWSSSKPSNDRDWSADQSVLPYIEFDGDVVSVHNIRDNDYASAGEYTPRYYDKSFRLDELESLWFIVEPFSGWKGAAHTFLSFGFEGGDYLAVSAEIRKEKGETFSALKGLFRRFELMYVVGDERDLIRLRTNYRGNAVCLYPAKATKEQLTTLLVDMLRRANRLREKPEFYNTLTNSCSINIARHINKFLLDKVPYSWQIVFPGYSDKFAIKRGMIDTDLPLEEARSRFNISERARKHGDAPGFSAKIRELDGA
ncbi:MAG: DUF4105 domain-containing protein [Elusimicrobiota bacterium]